MKLKKLPLALSLLFPLVVFADEAQSQRSMAARGAGPEAVERELSDSFEAMSKALKVAAVQARAALQQRDRALAALREAERRAAASSQRVAALEQKVAGARESAHPPSQVGPNDKERHVPQRGMDAGPRQESGLMLREIRSLGARIDALEGMIKQGRVPRGEARRPMSDDRTDRPAHDRRPPDDEGERFEELGKAVKAHEARAADIAADRDALAVNLDKTRKQLAELRTAHEHQKADLEELRKLAKLRADQVDGFREQLESKLKQSENARRHLERQLEERQHQIRERDKKIEELNQRLAAEAN